ncbi:histone-lysine N-methyltransferase set-1-like isoform X1 [Colossoma macropomum]|uniref:histone-lysine N-methyltransferase set-1-like isoform X1 n=1 Tax=Colossoma macropomum TaxID=42526 RepID=UPI001863ED3E|nr:histone-lysine N-methyltransferase set-1-like isoform X1 [Colossoma macropomum]
MRRRRVKPLDEAVQHVTSATDKTDVLESKLVNPYKGRGVFALASLNKGDFVVEYRGELIDFLESERRRKVSRITVFMFDFFWQNKQWCVDATREDDTLGRLVNDEHKDPNCKMKKIIVQGKPHLCLFAIRDIMPGEEITYDYGGSDWPWRRKSACKDTANMKDNVEPSRSASGPVTNAGASTSDLKPACKDSANMMDVVEPSRSASSPVTNSGTSSGLKPACEDTTNMMDDVEPCHSASSPVTNAGASSSDLKVFKKV